MWTVFSTWKINKGKITVCNEIEIKKLNIHQLSCCVWQFLCVIRKLGEPKKKFKSFFCRIKTQKKVKWVFYGMNFLLLLIRLVSDFSIPDDSCVQKLYKEEKQTWFEEKWNDFSVVLAISTLSLSDSCSSNERNCKISPFKFL